MLLGARISTRMIYNIYLLAKFANRACVAQTNFTWEIAHASLNTKERHHLDNKFTNLLFVQLQYVLWRVLGSTTQKDHGGMAIMMPRWLCGGEKSKDSYINYIMSKNIGTVCVSSDISFIYSAAKYLFILYIIFTFSFASMAFVVLRIFICIFYSSSWTLSEIDTEQDKKSDWQSHY